MENFTLFRRRYSQGTNVNTPSFQVTTLEFGHCTGTRVKVRDLVHPMGTSGWVPVHTVFVLGQPTALLSSFLKTASDWARWSNYSMYTVTFRVVKV